MSYEEEQKILEIPEYELTKDMQLKQKLIDWLRDGG